MLQINVPYLTTAQLDQVVAELLRNYARWRDTAIRPPIDVDEIAEGYLGPGLFSSPYAGWYDRA